MVSYTETCLLPPTSCVWQGVLVFPAIAAHARALAVAETSLTLSGKSSPF